MARVAVAEALAGLRRGTEGMSRTAGNFAMHHPRLGRAAHFATKTRTRKIMLGAAGLGIAANMHAAYGNLPGPNISSRNQNNRTLRRIRSSAANGLQARSMGGYA